MSKEKEDTGKKTKSLYDSIPAATDTKDPKYDPFRRHDASWGSPYEILKTVFVVIFILPIKIIFSIWWLSVYFVFIWLGTRGEKDPKGPPNKWGRFWASGILDTFKWANFKLTDWFTFSIGYPFIKSFGDNSLTCKKTGKKANIIVGNHSSYLDIFLLMTASEDVPGFVAKAEVQKVPFFGWISHFWRCIYVYRAGSSGAKSVTEQIQERAVSLGRNYLNDICSPLIF